MAKSKDLSRMTIEQLEKKLEEINKELIKARTQISTKITPDSPGKVKQNKKMIARIKTELKRREADKK